MRARCSMRRPHARPFLPARNSSSVQASDAATARLCRRYQVPYLPGAATATEIIRALEDGADIVKVFPGEVLGPGVRQGASAGLCHTRH